MNYAVAVTGGTVSKKEGEISSKLGVWSGGGDGATARAVGCIDL